MAEKTMYTYRFVSALPDEMDHLDLRHGNNIVNGVDHYVDAEWFNILRQMDHDFALLERYEEEHADRASEWIVIPDERNDPNRCILGDVEEGNVKLDLIRKVIMKLSDKDIDLLYEYYGERKKQIDIARSCGVSATAIRKRLRRIENKIRSCMDGWN